MTQSGCELSGPIQPGQVAATEHMQGVLVLVFGIVGVVANLVALGAILIDAMNRDAMYSPVVLCIFLGLFVSPCAFFAWNIGTNAKKEIETGAPYLWQGKIVVGYVLGVISSVVTILLFAGILVRVIF